MPGMIVAPEAFAVDAGAEVLARGGNAFDAAVTCAFAQGVLDPHDSSIGGYLVIAMHRAADGPNETTVMDAPALAGGRTSPGMWVDRYIGPNPAGWGFFLEGSLNEFGYTSICTPGILRGFQTILDRWGTIELGDAVEPAARLAPDGYAVDNRVAGYWLTPASDPHLTSTIDIVRANAAASKIYLKPDGNPYFTGEIIRNPDYAATLRQLGRSGADDFYSGALARRMAADLDANGAFVTAQDLATYEVQDVE